MLYKTIDDEIFKCFQAISSVRQSRKRKVQYFMEVSTENLHFSNPVCGSSSVTHTDDEEAPVKLTRRIKPARNVDVESSDEDNF
jgi:hypothetical protein